MSARPRLDLASTRAARKNPKSGLLANKWKQVPLPRTAPGIKVGRRGLLMKCRALFQGIPAQVQREDDSDGARCGRRGDRVGGGCEREDPGTVLFLSLIKNSPLTGHRNMRGLVPLVVRYILEDNPLPPSSSFPMLLHRFVDELIR